MTITAIVRIPWVQNSMMERVSGGIQVNGKGDRSSAGHSRARKQVRYGMDHR